MVWLWVCFCGWVSFGLYSHVSNHSKSQNTWLRNCTVFIYKYISSMCLQDTLTELCTEAYTYIVLMNTIVCFFEHIFVQTDMYSNPLTIEERGMHVCQRERKRAQRFSKSMLFFSCEDIWDRGVSSYSGSPCIHVSELWSIYVVRFWKDFCCLLAFFHSENVLRTYVFLFQKKESFWRYIQPPQSIPQQYAVAFVFYVLAVLLLAPQE